MRIHNIESKRLQYYLIISLTLAVVACVMAWIIRSLLDARYAELLRTERELRDSAEKFSKAFQANPSGIAITDMETGHIIEVNESFAHLYGYAPKDIAGTLHGREVGVWGKATQNREKLIQPLRASVGTSATLEMPTHTRERRHEDHRHQRHELIEAGRKAARRLAHQGYHGAETGQRGDGVENRFFLEAQASDSALDAILRGQRRAQADPAEPAPVPSCSRLPEEIALGNDDDFQLLKHVALRAKNPEQFEERVAYLYAHRDEIGRDVVEFQDGTILDRYTAPVLDKAGKYYGRIWTFREITEQRKLEQQLRQAQKMEAIGTLAGGIAHDFNNILTGIIGYIELMRMSLGNSPDYGDDLAAMANAAVRAKGLVRQILTFSRQETPQRQPLRLGPIVADAIKFLRSTIPSTVAIRFDEDEHAPVVMADATQAAPVVVMNLGTNAPGMP